MKLQLKRLSPTVKLPSYGTTHAARFDIHAALDHTTHLKGFDPLNYKYGEIAVREDFEDGSLFVLIPPKGRVLVPSGFSVAVPEGYEMTIVPRSSTALKVGLNMANDIGVIDSDYRNEFYMMVYNMLDTPVPITHNQRLCQGKIQPAPQVEFEEVENLPDPESNRVSGFGSTGR